MDERIREGLVLIARRKRQIALLKAELAKLAQQNARERTINNAELMGSAWYKLHNAIYMLGLLERAVLKIRKQQRASAQALPRPCSPCSDKPR